MPHKLATLIDIRHELLAPGGELRGQWRDLQERDVFLLQYGESDETLREGRLVEAKVRGMGGEGVVCFRGGEGSKGEGGRGGKEGGGGRWKGKEG